MSKEHHFQKMCEYSSFLMRSYSGRCMYGKECLAVDLERKSVGEFFATLFEDMNDQQPSEEDKEAFAEALRSHRTDHLGRGIIIYFPDIPYTDDCAESERQDHLDDLHSDVDPTE